jgi:hypothetical protein
MECSPRESACECSRWIMAYHFQKDNISGSRSKCATSQRVEDTRDSLRHANRQMICMARRQTGRCAFKMDLFPRRGSGTMPGEAKSSPEEDASVLFSGHCSYSALEKTSPLFTDWERKTVQSTWKLIGVSEFRLCSRVRSYTAPVASIRCFLYFDVLVIKNITTATQASSPSKVRDDIDHHFGNVLDLDARHKKAEGETGSICHEAMLWESWISPVFYDAIQAMFASASSLHGPWR